MVRLTRLDGTPMVLNADLIRFIESLPDTYVTLTNGDRIIVRESVDAVMDKAVAYQQTKNLYPPGFRSDSPSVVAG